MRYITTGFILLFVSLLYFSCELGEQPLGPGADNSNTVMQDTLFADTVTNTMRVTIEPTEIPASNTHSAKVTVWIFDEISHNPIVGKEVRFTTNPGIITSADTSDEFGMAYAKLNSVPKNGEGRVTATVIIDGKPVSASAIFSLSGAKVTIRPSVTNAIVNATVPVTVEAVDASGAPIGGKKVVLSGALNSEIILDDNGLFDTVLTATKDTVLTIHADAQFGSVDDASIKFWEGTIPGSVVDTVDKIRNLRVFSSKSQLSADNTDNATITVILLNENNNPAIGDTVKFKTDLGGIDAFGIVDSTGRAIATLRSSPINGECTVFAISGNYQDSTKVVFSGVNISLSANPVSVHVGSSSIVEAVVRDASGNPIGQDNITFLVKYPDTTTQTTVALNPLGRAEINLLSSVSGVVFVRATSLNASDSISLMFSRNTLSLTSSNTQIKIGGSDSVVIFAHYTNSAGISLQNQTIYFASNAGTINVDSAITDALGNASIILKSGTFATNATVSAWAKDSATSKIDVKFIAVEPANIKLEITPDNIGINGGVANLVATVTDSNGNVTSNVDVTFKIINGPGGNEHIVTPVSMADNGVARSQLKAGSLSSAYRGCEVSCCVNGICDTSKLTISGDPYIITVSRPEDDTVVVSNAGLMDESTFGFNIGAVVQDVNGNPVADGTEVHFSAVVSGMVVYSLILDHFQISSEESKAVLKYAYKDIPFEDINGNMKMDKGIDLDIDWNSTVACRGDDKNGDGVVDYNRSTYDFFWDFNSNGVCDTGVGEPVYVDSDGKTHPSIFADLNQNGIWDSTELAVDHNGNGVCDLPSSGDFCYWMWEMSPVWRGMKFDFGNNDFAVTINASAVTSNGVAYAKIVYPRQFARRLIATVNAEANGIRDKDGERFILPIVKSGN